VRGTHSCRQCSQKGRLPVGTCENCNAPFCDRHRAWDTTNDRWLCTRCGRKLAKEEGISLLRM
jgi:hypothetical protein